jgi:hypothetical protein
VLRNENDSFVAVAGGYSIRVSFTAEDMTVGTEVVVYASTP